MAWYNPGSWSLGGTLKNLTLGPLGGYLYDKFMEPSSGPVDPAVRNLGVPHFEQDRERIGNAMKGQSPFAGSDWGALVTQLQQRAAGQGPSMAENAYKQASNDTNAQLMSMARGSNSPGAARQALLQTGKIGQGMAQGLATARTQEMQGATDQLGQVMGTRDQLNQNAYTNLLAQQLGLSEMQLRAGMANQQYDLGIRGVLANEQGAKYAALAGLLGGIGKVATGRPG